MPIPDLMRRILRLRDGYEDVKTLIPEEDSPVVVYVLSASADPLQPFIPMQNGNPAVVGRQGFFIEDLIEVARHRIQTLNARFPCEENAQAVEHLGKALQALEERTRRVSQK